MFTSEWMTQNLLRNALYTRSPAETSLNTSAPKLRVLQMLTGIVTIAVIGYTARILQDSSLSRDKPCICPGLFFARQTIVRLESQGNVIAGYPYQAQGSP